MNTRTSLICLGSLCAWLLATASMSAAPSFAMSAAPAAARPALEKGMTAAEVTALVGQPAEVRALSSADGKAEIWVYRRLVSACERQAATATRLIPAFGGPAMPDGGIVLVNDCVYQQEYTKTWQVTSLLMVDGRLELGRQRIERSVSYH